jgi:uncharacterized OB-fold protein
MPRPYPIPDRLTQPFWDAANRGELQLQRCGDCSRYQFPPSLICVDCGSEDLAWTKMSGRGRVHSYSIVHDARYKGFREIQPYAYAQVELEEQPLLVLMSTLPGVPLEDVRIGMKVELTFFRPVEHQAIPEFTGAAGELFRSRTA